HPAQFAAALLNSQPMGFYAPAQLVGDSRKHGIEVRGVDVNQSCGDCTIEERALRLGLRLVRGLARRTAEAIETKRPSAGFCSFDDFSRRTRLTAAEVTKLAHADAFQSLSLDR